MSNIKGYIYKISNCVNDKIYIGMTKLPVQYRFILHLSKAKKGVNNKLYKEMNDLGLDKFTFSILEEIHSTDIRPLKNIEKIYINEYNCIENGLNTYLPNDISTEKCLNYKKLGIPQYQARKDYLLEYKKYYNKRKKQNL